MAETPIADPDLLLTTEQIMEAIYTLEEYHEKPKCTGCNICGGLDLPFRSKRPLPFSKTQTCADCERWACRACVAFEPCDEAYGTRLFDMIQGLAALSRDCVAKGAQQPFYTETVGLSWSDRDRRAGKTDKRRFIQRLLGAALGIKPPKIEDMGNVRTYYLMNLFMPGTEHLSWPKIGAALVMGVRIAHSPKLKSRQSEMWVPHTSSPIWIRQEFMRLRVYNTFEDGKKTVPAIFFNPQHAEVDIDDNNACPTHCFSGRRCKRKRIGA